MNYPERIVPAETSPGILALHLKRYEFAARWCESRDVLDAGCGTGYGSAFLASHARSVVGVDRAEEALVYARSNYAAANTDFVQADVLDLPFPDRSFDVVCAFETIEHLENQRAFLRETIRVVRPGGTVVISTPRVERTKREPANPFHRVELAPADFEELLREFFAEVALYGERRLQTRRHRLLQRLDVLGLRRRLPPSHLAGRVLGTPATAHIGLDEITISREGLEDASEIVAVCNEARPG